MSYSLKVRILMHSYRKKGQKSKHESGNYRQDRQDSIFYFERERERQNLRQLLIVYQQILPQSTRKEKGGYHENILVMKNVTRWFRTSKQITTACWGKHIRRERQNKIFIFKSSHHINMKNTYAACGLTCKCAAKASQIFLCGQENLLTGNKSSVLLQMTIT